MGVDIGPVKIPPSRRHPLNMRGVMRKEQDPLMRNNRADAKKKTDRPAEADAKAATGFINRGLRGPGGACENQVALY